MPKTSLTSFLDLPDAFYLALPILSFSKTPNLDAFEKLPGFKLHPTHQKTAKAYLGYCVRSWKDLPKRTMQGVVSIFCGKSDQGSKLRDFQKIALNDHSWSALDYSRKTQTYLVLSRKVQQCPLERMGVFDDVRMSRFPSG